jgi:hypothetical protein
MIDLMPGFGAFTPATTASTISWNPADKSSRVLLSISDTRASYDGAGDFTAAAVRTTVSKSTGKWVFEISVGTDYHSPGLANASAPLAQYPGADGGLNVFYSQVSEGAWKTNNDATTLGTGATINNGSEVTFAVDLDAELFWVAVDGGDWNNSGSADPATGTGGFDFSSLNAGPWFPIVYMNFNGRVADIRNTGMAKAIPSGFSAWA